MERQPAWEFLRTEARQLELRLQSKLQSLEEIANFDESAVTADSPSCSSQDRNNQTHVFVEEEDDALHREPRERSHGQRRSLASVEAQFHAAKDDIRNGLERLDQLVRSMLELCRDESPLSPSTKYTERMQGVAAEAAKSLHRTEEHFRRCRERLQLLPSISKDLKMYEESAGMRLLMKEQNSLHHANARAHRILDQADDAHGRMSAQKDRFANMGDQLLQIAERVPAIQQVLRRIDAKRRKDAVILGVVVGVCLFLCLIFW